MNNLLEKFAKLLSEKKIQTPYDGFDLEWALKEIRAENIKQKSQGQGLFYSLYRPFIPLEWRKRHQYWFKITDITKCLRMVGYKVLGEEGRPLTVEDERRLEKGSIDHERLEKEYRMFSLSLEGHIFDPDEGVYGKDDMMARNFITGELFPHEFKTLEQWMFQTMIKRAGLRKHLSKTCFYVPMPYDELQVMLQIRLWRKLIRWPEIPINYGLITYENKNNPNQRKRCLVEYDEKIIEKFFEKLAELRQYLKDGQNIQPYLPLEAYAHVICPYNNKCPRGLEALKNRPQKKNIPLWMMYHIKRRSKHKVIGENTEKQPNLFKTS